MNPEQFTYDTAYSPPAPVIQVLLSNPFNPSRQIQVVALVDTGADITVLPTTTVSHLGLVQLGEIWVRSFDGISRLHTTYLVDVQIGERRFDFIEVLAALTNELILGRDVLNQLDIRLNGPQLVLEILNA